MYETTESKEKHLMTIEKLRPSFTFTEERLRELQAVVPEAFADGKINWEVLREALGDYLEEETQEHFGLTWPGKREARRLAALPPQGTLVPVPGEGVNEDTTRNIFIEGENLEVLKSLQKSYAGRIRMIYIDPPYNTGNDFVYPDDYSEPLEGYLRRTGQMDEEGNSLTTNTRSSGRFHSNWLSMLYPRLLLSRQLLSDEGLIFVSIDDNEIHNLRQLMNEVYGEENFVAQITVQSNPRGRQSERFVATVHEYVLIYAKNSEYCIVEGVPLTAKQESEFKYKDNKGNRYRLLGLRQRGSASRREDRPNMYFPIYVNPNDATVSLDRSESHCVEVFPKKSTNEDGRWMWGKDRVNSNRSIVEASYISRRDEWDIFVRDYLVGEDGSDRTRKFKTIWDEKEINYQNGTRELKDIFDTTQSLLDYPKPVYLLRQILRMSGSGSDEIYLDFFAGSCTTADAVLQQTRSDGTVRQFIMVQLPEPLASTSSAYKAGFQTISEIGKDRIRRVIRRMASKKTSDEDLGFRSFRLTRSHFVAWEVVDVLPGNSLGDLFTEKASPLAPGWQLQNLLSEILLLEGFPLDSQVLKLNAFEENDVWRIHHFNIGHDIYICLDETIAPVIVERLKTGEIVRGNDALICLDSALSDEAKVVLDDRLRLKVI